MTQRLFLLHRQTSWDKFFFASKPTNLIILWRSLSKAGFQFCWFGFNYIWIERKTTTTMESVFLLTQGIKEVLMAGQIFGRKCHFVRIFVLQSLLHINNAYKETIFVQCGQAFGIICTSYHALFTRKNHCFVQNLAQPLNQTVMPVIKLAMSKWKSCSACNDCT